MIKDSTYAPERLIAVSKKVGRRVDPKMLEKVVYAFTLLEQLRVNNVDLIFKGGTCLLLMIDPPRRFSIDIDIITEASAEQIEATLNVIVKNSRFTRWVSDNDRKHVIDAPVGHYKIYYASALDQHYGEEPILLDILYTSNPYPAIQDLEVKHAWLETDGESVQVSTPIPESILGDKLTAFAPNTTGILYSKGRHTEIIKQLFDIGTLFDVSENLEVVNAAYQRVVQEEIGFRKLKLDAHGVLDDTFRTCWILSTREASDALTHLTTGIRNITNFIMGHFKIEEAITAAAKTAYLCQLLKKENLEAIQRFSNPLEVRDWTIEDQNYNKLNKLKKSNPEAFYYWYLAIKAMNV
jgi:hypothetical protein